jgi:hypothetical protein
MPRGVARRSEACGAARTPIQAGSHVASRAVPCRPSRTQPQSDGRPVCGVGRKNAGAAPSGARRFEEIVIGFSM